MKYLVENTVTMTTSQQFLDAISAAPDDYQLRAQFAGWLESQGNPLCHEWRNQAAQSVVLAVSQDVYVHPSFYTDGQGDGRGDGRILFTNDLPPGDGDGCGKGPGWGDGLGYGFSHGNSFDPGDGFGLGLSFFRYTT